MTGQVESRELRRYVVRLDDVNGTILGSGFFVAPGWVLTCAHVVNGANRVLVVPNEAVAVPVSAEVAARTATPSDAGALWPFPDLALVRMDGSEFDHPCVLLEASDPVGECHAWGFARREFGIDPVGSPVSFQFEGVEGDGYLRLKAGQAAPGLSGAPLVCPIRRAVVGVMTASRDVNSELGGWATPISALLAGGPGVPEDLAALSEQILGLNRAAVLADRLAWHRVLPVDGAQDVLDQPWASFSRQPRSSPADLLRADFGVVPYLFRDQVVAEVLAWCAAPSPMEVLTVAGVGGAGKTRFAIEVCRRLADLGWVAGLWRPGSSVATVPLPRLLVVDYAEAADVEVLREALESLRRQATDMAPVRVLLLNRTREGRTTDPLDALREHVPAPLQTILDGSDDSSAATQPLAGEQRHALYAAAVDRFHQAWFGQSSPAPGLIAAPDLSDDRYALPLEVLFEAFDATLTGPDGGPTSSRPPVERVLRHEQRYWEGTAPDMTDVDSDLRRRCVAMATLVGAADDEEAHALLAMLPPLQGEAAAERRRQLIGWLSGLYDGPNRLNPLRPDRLGEALVAEVLQESAEGGAILLRAIFDGVSDEQLARTLDVLTRLTSSDAQAAEAAGAALAGRHTALVDRGVAQARGTADRPGSLTLAGALMHLMANGLSDRIRAALARAASHNSASQRDLAQSYQRLGDLAFDSGRLAEAEQLYLICVRIREALAEAEPANAYGYDLAVSYERLGDLASGSGRLAEAEQLYRQCLGIREALVRAEPQNVAFRRDLAIAYIRLADLARDTGRWDVAENLYRRSLEIRDMLLAEDPENIALQRDVTVAHERLADHLARNLQRWDLAAPMYRRNMERAEALVDADPDNADYRRDLAVSHERLAEVAHVSGNDQEDEQRLTASAGIRRSLAQQEPYRLDLAEELAGVLFLLARTRNGVHVSQARQEIAHLLSPFEQAGTITPKGQFLLDWARQ